MLELSVAVTASRASENPAIQGNIRWRISHGTPCASYMTSGEMFGENVSSRALPTSAQPAGGEATRGSGQLMGNADTLGGSERPEGNPGARAWGKKLAERGGIRTHVPRYSRDKDDFESPPVTATSVPLRGGLV